MKAKPPYPIKKLNKADKHLVSGKFPNFSATGNIYAMRKIYGENCMLVECDGYIYDVQSDPSVFKNAYNTYYGKIGKKQ